MSNGVNNVIQYTSKTFEAILTDINNDNELVDKPNWWKRGIAGIGDVIAMWNNALANNLLLRTAYTRRNVTLLLELIDYQISPQTTANGTVLFYMPGTATFPFTVAKTDLVALTTGTLSVSSKRFEARSGVTVNAVTEAFLPGAVNTGTDEITLTREFITGEKVRFTTSGTLPSPLATGTDYYVIATSTTTIKLVSTLQDAYDSTNIIDLTTTGTGTHQIELYSFRVTMYQQQTKDAFVAGESDGVTPFQEIELADINILEDTLNVVINSITWTRVDTLVDSVSTDTHYRLFYETDNSARIQFGNGDFGAIPPAFDVNVDYAFGGGSDSNVTAINRLNVYSGTNTNIDGVSNPASLTGGDDPQDIEEAKILGPLLLKARDRFVTSTDGEALALSFGGIEQAKVLKNEFGVLSAKVITIASGGGNPSSSTKTALQTFLIDRTILESIDVRVQDTTITATNATSGVKLLPGFVWSGGVEDYYRLAWKLFLSEAGLEIRNEFIANGIASAVSLINIIFTETFDSDDYEQIRILLEQLEPRLIGEDIQESDAFGYLDPNIVGIDYITISVPTFPVVLADDEITTVGTLTLSEIP